MEGSINKEPESEQESLDHACQKFQNYADNLPELQAILRFFSTVPCSKQRLRLCTEWLNKSETLKTYSSEYFPFEMKWYMENVLPKQSPTVAELMWHQHGLLETNRTLFSYIDPTTGLLARNGINLLVDPNEPDYMEAYNIACAYSNSITDLGGISFVLHAPDVTAQAIHVVIGYPKKSWVNYHVPIYSPELFDEALTNKYFDPKLIYKFELQQCPPPNLRIEYLSKLV